MGYVFEGRGSSKLELFSLPRSAPNRRGEGYPRRSDKKKWLELHGFSHLKKSRAALHPSAGYFVRAPRERVYQYPTSMQRMVLQCSPRSVVSCVPCWSTRARERRNARGVTLRSKIRSAQRLGTGRNGRCHARDGLEHSDAPALRWALLGSLPWLLGGWGPS